MVTVLVAIDTVYKQMVAIPFERKGKQRSICKSQSGRIRTIRRTSQSDLQGDSEYALMAVIHDACAMLTAATPRTSPVNSKGSNGAA